MGLFVARKVATAASAGSGIAAATNLAEELRTVPWLMQQGFQGNVYIAGHGLEETATDGEAAIDETTPTFSLMAPAGGTIIVPIWAEFRMHAEGGAAPDMWLSYVGVDRTNLTTGTSLDKLQINGSATDSLARVLKTVTAVPAITSAQTVLLARRADVLDNYISVEAATTRSQIQSLRFDPLSLEFNFWDKFGGAFQLYAGRSIMFHTATGTSDSTYSATFLWAEVPSATYDHIA